jgi:hypothetical protein
MGIKNLTRSKIKEVKNLTELLVVFGIPDGLFVKEDHQVADTREHFVKLVNFLKEFEYWKDECYHSFNS